MEEIPFSRDQLQLGPGGQSLPGKPIGGSEERHQALLDHSCHYCRGSYEHCRLRLSGPALLKSIRK